MIGKIYPMIIVDYFDTQGYRCGWWWEKHSQS